jgi:hypothetical protein
MPTKAEKINGEKVREAILTQNQLILKLALKKMFSMQTLTEKVLKRTQVENGVGFNIPDGNIMTDITIWTLNGLDIPEESLELVANRIKKYSIQLGGYPEIMDVINDIISIEEAIKGIPIEIEVETTDGMGFSEFLGFRDNRRKEEAKRLRNEKAKEKRELAKIEREKRRDIELKAYNERKAKQDAYWEQRRLDRENERKEGNKYFPIEAEIIAETEKAILINKEQNEVWIPKSQIEQGTELRKNANLTIPIKKWILKRNGLIPS